jgi:secreted trypsin-like serine protease
MIDSSSIVVLVQFDLKKIKNLMRFFLKNKHHRKNNNFLWVFIIFLLCLFGLVLSSKLNDKKRKETTKTQASGDVSHISNTMSNIVGFNSKLAPDGAYPYFVSIATYDGFIFCGGALIDPNWILTAGHCIYQGVIKPNTFTYQLVSGTSSTYTLNGDKPIVTLIGVNHFDQYLMGVGHNLVDKIVLHELYNDSSLDNDIALLHLHKSVQNSPTLSLFDSNTTAESLDLDTIILSDSLPLTTIGFGVRDQNNPGTPSKDLYMVVLNDGGGTSSTYRRSLNGKFYIYSNSTGISIGDSGGPVVGTYNNIQYIVGINSAIQNSELPKYKYAGSFTSVSHFYSWIKNITGIQADRVSTIQKAIQTPLTLCPRNTSESDCNRIDYLCEWDVQQYLCHNRSNLPEFRFVNPSP